jgi:transposase
MDVASLPDDPAELKALLLREWQTRQAECQQHEEVVAGYEDTVQSQQRTIEQQEQTIARLLRRLSGPKQERIDPNQLTLFDAEELEALVAELAAEAEASAEEAGSSGRKRRRRGHGRRGLPKHLPREQRVYELPEADRACPCCGEMRQEIGRETSEQLEFIPASFKIIEHLRLKYACRHCEEHVAIASKPPQPIEKGLPGPGLLAHTVLSKYGDHTPLYRQEDIAARHGILLRRSTLCDWIAAAADLALPLYERMCQLALQSKVLHTDDTSVKLLDPLLGHARTAKFWVYVGDAAHPYSVYDFTISRQRDGPTKFLQSFEGYLQADAYSGYDGIYVGSEGAIIEVACWAHCRRYWWEARTTDPRRGHEALAYIARLYQIESLVADAPSEQRRDFRQQQALPILETFRAWIDQQGSQVLPKSPIAKAMTYTLNQWDALVRYTQHGDLSIDNNISERMVKIPALGRKNWRAPDVLSRTSGRLGGSGCLVGNVQRTVAVWSAICI